MAHTKEYIDKLMKMFHEDAHAAGIEWDSKVRRTAQKIAEKSDNAYDAYRAFCDYLYFK